MSVMPEETRREKRPVDFVDAGSLLSEEERAIREGARGFVDREVSPTAADYWDRAEFPFDLLPSLGEFGVMGGCYGEEYGCAGWNKVSYGLAIAELARGSGSLSTLLHVQSGLAMAAIHELGWDGLGQATDCHETALAREVLGGEGILLDYRGMEHMADVEGVYSYEGTHDVNTLIVGQAITGHRAFAPRPPKKDGRAEEKSP